MKELVKRFSTQLREALEIAQRYQFKTQKVAFSNILLTGLGGSGIGGTIVQDAVRNQLAIPFTINKEYGLPHFTGSKTLVIVSSYSGNTEETVAALEEAIKRGATIVCITSGGKVAELAEAHNFDCIMLPGGMPPRSCLGYSLTQVLAILVHFSLIPASHLEEIGEAASLLDREEGDIQTRAADLAGFLKGKIPVLYSAASLEGVAIRFRQQLNENSKMLAWHNVLPEMNHNELVGWRDDASGLAVVFLRNSSDYDRVQKRIELNKQVIEQHGCSHTDIFSKGETYWEKAFYLIHLTDWSSVLLADLRGVDATEVKVIDHLKGELNKVEFSS